MKPYLAYKDSGIEWLGEIPDHWEVVLLKRLLKAIKDGTHGTFERFDEGKPLLSAKNVFPDGIRTDDGESLISEADFDEIVKNGFPCKGDVLLTIVGTIGRAFVYNFDYPLAFQRSVAFLRFKSSVNPYYYYYFSQTPYFIGNLYSFAKTSAQSGIYMRDVVQVPVIQLSTEEQRAIAAYLDHKTRLIDTYVAKKQQQIERLQAYRTALINQAVTKGLNPDAPMKDSGIECLGEIPAGWESKKIKHEFESLDHKRIPLSGEVRGAMENKLYDYYGASGVIDKVEDYIFDETLILLGEDGANLYSRSTPLAFLAKGKYWVNNHAHILKPRNGNINYFVNLLESIDYTPSITGSAQPKLTIDNLKNIRIPVPPLPEQHVIAAYIEEQTAKIDTLIAKTQRQIDRLQAYRTALISNAVTGKIDVRTTGIAHKQGFLEGTTGMTHKQGL